jgi:NAD(P)-dependent dehydrogenase (short-subunit alcohol dehydrogenase family)
MERPSTTGATTGNSSFYHLTKAAVLRTVFGLGHELNPYRATAVSLTPGWLRSEAMLEAYGSRRSAGPHLGIVP